MEVRGLYWYLSAVPELMAIVADRFEAFTTDPPAGVAARSAIGTPGQLREATGSAMSGRPLIGVMHVRILPLMVVSAFGHGGVMVCTS